MSLLNAKREKKIIGIIPIYKANIIDIDRILELPISINELIIADDSGNDFSWYIKEKSTDKTVKCICNNEFGLSKTLNRALKIAIDDGADWVLILNQDSKVHDDIMYYYFDYLENNNCDHVAILAPQHDYDRHERMQSEGWKSIRYADLAGCLFNIKVINQIGDFDEFCYIDGLDTEWCLRARRKGYKIIRCNMVVIGHKPGETKQIKVANKTVFQYGWHSAKRYYYQFLSGIYIHYKYHDLLSDMTLAYKIIKALILFDEKDKYLMSLRKAIHDYKNGNYFK